jgi:hypothetical protein
MRKHRGKDSFTLVLSMIFFFFGCNTERYKLHSVYTNGCTSYTFTNKV